MLTNEELKCPVCGGELRLANNILDMVRVECGSLGCWMGPFEDTIDEAWDAARALMQVDRVAELEAEVSRLNQLLSFAVDHCEAEYGVTGPLACTPWYREAKGWARKEYKP